MLPRAAVAGPVVREAEGVRDAVQLAFEGGFLSPWTHAEWLMVAEFAGFAVRARLRPAAPLDGPVLALERAVAVVGAERIPIAGFERLPHFAAQASPALGAEYDRLVAAPRGG